MATLVMTEDEARGILGGSIQPDGSLSNNIDYIFWRKGSDTVGLDAPMFTADQLLAIAADERQWLEAVNQMRQSHPTYRSTHPAKTRLEELYAEEAVLLAKRDSVERKLKSGSTHVSQDTLTCLNNELVLIQAQIAGQNNPALVTAH